MKLNQFTSKTCAWLTALALPFTWILMSAILLIPENAFANCNGQTGMQLLLCKFSGLPFMVKALLFTIAGSALRFVFTGGESPSQKN
jgi:hypothetical protein